MLNQVSRIRNVFVSGSAYDSEPLGEMRLSDFCCRLGKVIIDSGFNVASGFGLNVGDKVVMGAIGSLYKQNGDIYDRLMLWPFIYQAPNSIATRDFYTYYRKGILSRTGICIFIAGNKYNTDSNSTSAVDANGVLEEFEIAESLNQYLIPIGATGHVAQKLWQKVMGNLNKYFPGYDVQGHFEVLGKETSTNDELLDAVLGILKQIEVACG